MSVGCPPIVCVGPLSGILPEFMAWAEDAGYCCEVRAHCRRGVGRLSEWLMERDVGVVDMTHQVIEEYIASERSRLRGNAPAVCQWMAMFRKFLVASGRLEHRPAASRKRGGIPWLSVGPLAPVVIGELVGWLNTERYATAVVAKTANSAARLSAWMRDNGFGLTDLEDGLLDRFVAAQDRADPPRRGAAHYAVTVRKFLVTNGYMVPRPISCVPAGIVDREIIAWLEWQRAASGASPGYLRERARWVRDLVAGLADTDHVNWDRLDVTVLNDYVTRRGHGYSLSSQKDLAGGLRSLMRWALVTNRIRRDLSGGILAIRSPRAVLPRGLSQTAVERLLTQADVTTVKGLRDRAVVVLLSRLGIRAGEAAGLRLDDIDWAAGRLTVVGKNSRRLTLPLPADVGGALVEWLRVRPPAKDRAVFVRLRPPLSALTTAGLSSIVASLAEQAGLGVVRAHRLRHTVATQVIAAGGSLVEARELLGHASSSVTMGYARTDLAGLRTLTVPFGRVPS